MTHPFFIKRINQKIEKLWSKTYNTQSEAHFRAEEITRLKSKRYDNL